MKASIEIEVPEDQVNDLLARDLREKSAIRELKRSKKH